MSFFKKKTKEDILRKLHKELELVIESLKDEYNILIKRNNLIKWTDKYSEFVNASISNMRKAKHVFKILNKKRNHTIQHCNNIIKSFEKLKERTNIKMENKVSEYEKIAMITKQNSKQQDYDMEQHIHYDHKNQKFLDYNFVKSLIQKKDESLREEMISFLKILTAINNWLAQFNKEKKDLLVELSEIFKMKGLALKYERFYIDTNAILHIINTFKKRNLTFRTEKITHIILCQEIVKEMRNNGVPTHIINEFLNFSHNIPIKSETELKKELFKIWSQEIIDERGNAIFNNSKARDSSQRNSFKFGDSSIMADAINSRMKYAIITDDGDFEKTLKLYYKKHPAQHRPHLIINPSVIESTLKSNSYEEYLDKAA